MVLCCAAAEDRGQHLESWLIVAQRTLMLSDKDIALILTLLNTEVQTNEHGRSVSAAMLYRKMERY